MAQSPDEEALVMAARQFGFVFKSRTPKSITIEVFEREEHYDLLCILDFNNDRKRMSVVVKDANSGKLLLFCKGADTMVLERISQKSKDQVKIERRLLLNIPTFSAPHNHNGTLGQIRTGWPAHIVLGVQRARSGVFQEGLLGKQTRKERVQIALQWSAREREANLDITDKRGKLLDDLYEELERDMTLLGATAIEDKLQDGVPETIANLAQANIKIWVLTGDKQARKRLTLANH